MSNLTEEIRVRMSREMLVAIKKAASDYDVTQGFIVRESVTKFLLTLVDQEKDLDIVVGINNEKAINAIFSTCVTGSNSWDDLQSCLGENGLCLIARGGGLALAKLSNNSVVCKASEAGYGYSDLIRKFKTGFPGHNHSWIAERVLQPKGT